MRYTTNDGAVSNVNAQLLPAAGSISPARIEHAVSVGLSRDYLDDAGVFSAPRASWSPTPLNWHRVLAIPGRLDAGQAHRWQRLLTSLHAPYVRLVFLLSRTNGICSVHIGTGSRDAGAGEGGAASRLQRAVNSIVPQLRLEAAQSPETNAGLVRTLRRLSSACVVTGIPRTIRPEDRRQAEPLDLFGALGQAATGFTGASGGRADCVVMAVADAVSDSEIAQTLGALRNLGSSLHELVRGSRTVSSSSTDTQYRLPEPYSFILSLLPLPLWSWFMTKYPSVSDTLSDSVSTETCNYVARHGQALVDRHLQRLAQGQSLGFWNTSLYVLADTPDTVQGFSGVIRSAIAGSGTEVEPVRVLPVPPRHRAIEFIQAFDHIPLPRGEAGAHWHPFGDAHQYISTPINTEELVTITQVPPQDIPGLRADWKIGRFALNGPCSGEADREISLGAILGPGGVRHGDYYLPLDAFVRHGAVTGATGTGKSSGLRGLLGDLDRYRVPWLVIEPANDTWARWAVAQNRSLPPESRIAVYMPGSESLDGMPVEPLFLNPFEPPGTAGFRANVLHWLQRVAELLNLCLPMAESLPILLEAAVLRLGETHFGSEFAIPYGLAVYPRLETLSDHVRYYLREHKGGGYYADSVKENLNAALDVRIDSLSRGIRGDVLNAAGSTPWTALFERRVVVNLSKAGDSGTRSLLMSLLLIALWDWRKCLYETDPVQREQAQANRLCHLALVEEAHSVLRAPLRSRAESADPQAAVATMFEDMLAEVRQYGQGLVLINQGVTDLIPGALKNTGVKITYRQQHAEDREAVAASMGLDRDQTHDAGKLALGEAIVSTDIDPNPCHVAIRRGGA